MLREFLAERAALKFQLGKNDCGLFIADWVRRVTGYDAGAAVRGRYHDDESLVALAAAAGGLEALFDHCLIGAGLSRTDAPALGDVALLSILGTEPRGAIKTDAGFVLAAPHGLHGIRNMKSVRLIAAWRLPLG